MSFQSWIGAGVMVAMIAVSGAVVAQPSGGEVPTPPTSRPAVYRVVWQVTADTPEQWASIFRNVENFRESVGAANTRITVVAHGSGIGLVRTSNAAMADQIKSFSEAGIRFVACENTMKRKQIEKTDILPGVGFVDSGVAEVVRLQSEGYAYIKAGE